MPGEHLDLSTDGPAGDDAGSTAGDRMPAAGAGQGGKPFVGMHFTCCDIYTRIYLNTQRTMFYGALSALRPTRANQGRARRQRCQVLHRLVTSRDQC